MKTVNISYQQGGYFTIERTKMSAAEALNALEKVFDTDENHLFDVKFNGKTVPWESLETVVSLEEETELFIKIMVTFDVIAEIEIDDDADSLEAAYDGLSFTADGWEDEFDVTHSEMIEV